MNKELLMKALCINDSYTIENLKKLESNEFNKECKKYADLIGLFSDFENEGIKSKFLSEIVRQKKNNDRFILDYTSAQRKNYSLIDELNSTIKELTEEKDLRENTNPSKYIDLQIDEGDRELLSILDSPERNDVIFQIECIKVAIWRHLESITNPEDRREYRKNIVYFREIYDRIKDLRLKRIMRLVIEDILRSRDQYSAHMYYKFCFKQIIRRIYENEAFDNESLMIMRFCGQIALYLISLEHKESINSENIYHFENEVINFMACLICGSLYKYKKIGTESIFFAKKGIRAVFPDIRFDAFDIVGHMAMESLDWQFANDVYVSWLNQKAVGIIEKIGPENYSWGEDENNWRETRQGKEACATMHSKLAYVCGKISETYEISSKQGRNFYDLALKNLIKAIEDNSKIYSFHFSYGALLSDDMNYSMGSVNQLNEHMDVLKNAWEQFKICKYSPYVEEKMASRRQCCMTIMKLIFFATYQSKNNLWENEEVINYYNELKKEIYSYKTVNFNKGKELNKYLQTEIRCRDDLEKALPFLFKRKKSDLANQINILLIAIYENITILKEYLHRREYISTNYYTRGKEKDQNREDKRKVAYYTTLKNVTHIFEELVQSEQDKAPRLKADKEDGESKNCLTVMNAKYMNDPYEGKVILEELTKQIEGRKLFSDKKTDGFIKGIFDKNFVFLKSFTEEVDKLTMWNRYANDYNGEGKNSNGCCVLVDPACFVNNNEFTKNGIPNFDEKQADDYSLYRVVYISRDGTINKNKNQGLHNNVYKLYENLKDLFIKLDDCLKEYSIKPPKDFASYTESIENTLLNSLIKILFLFKYDDYCDEQESRLILFRDESNQDDIRLISGDIPMLAINPFFQIMINEIIFGPNVRNSEKWKPYFQYQLNQMWEKHMLKDAQNNIDDNQKYKIKESEIMYLT